MPSATKQSDERDSPGAAGFGCLLLACGRREGGTTCLGSSRRGLGTKRVVRVVTAMPKSLRRLSAVIVLLAYPAVALYPYRWDPPRLVDNSVINFPGGGLRFSGPEPAIARTPGPPDWVASAIRTHRLEILLEVRPLTMDEHGPAPILTLSTDPVRNPEGGNVTVAQSHRDLILRLRSRWDGEDIVREMRVLGVFGPARWVDLKVVIDSRSLRVEVDGQTRLAARLAAAPLRDWDPSHRLALGNELTCDRPWHGDIRHAIVRTEGAEVDYAVPGVLHVPSFLWIFSTRPRLIPLAELNPGDALLNVVGFVPLGLMLGLWRRETLRGDGWRVIAAVIAVSLTLEILQLFFSGRYPSVNDLLMNTLGGALGAWLSGLVRRAPVISDRLGE